MPGPKKIPSPIITSESPRFKVDHLLGLDRVRPQIKAEPCPLCKSDQVQVCMDGNNPTKDFAKCRIGYCQAPLRVWNNRS